MKTPENEAEVASHDLFADLVSCLREAVDEGHSPYCDAIHGPPGERWTVESDCDCWRRKAVELLSKANMQIQIQNKLEEISRKEIFDLLVDGQKMTIVYWLAAHKDKIIDSEYFDQNGETIQDEKLIEEIDNFLEHLEKGA